MKVYEKTYSFEKREQYFKDIYSVVRIIGKDIWRHNLNVLKVEDNRITATDGKRVCIVNFNYNIEPGFYRVLVSTKSKIVISKNPNDSKMEYPNIDRVLPDISKMNSFSLSNNMDISIFFGQIVETTKCYININYLKDLPKSNYKIYYNSKETDSIVCFESDIFTAYIMPMIKDVL